MDRAELNCPGYANEGGRAIVNSVMVIVSAWIDLYL